jgi:epoxyqueuosine reductase
VLGGWVFGCDLCQEVCPWNDGAIPVTDRSFRPGPSLLEGDLAGLVRLDGTAFRRCWAESPLARTRRRGLVRNALIVAANRRDESALTAARECLIDADPVVRATAAWCLGRACPDQIRRDLARALAREKDPAVRGEITAALEGRTGAEDSVPE